MIPRYVNVTGLEDMHRFPLILSIFPALNCINKTVHGRKNDIVHQHRSRSGSQFAAVVVLQFPALAQRIRIAVLHYQFRLRFVYLQALVAAAVPQQIRIRVVIPVLVS